MKKVSMLLLLILLTMGAETLFACAVCFGDPNSSLTIGAKAGVAFLLGVVVFVLGSFAAVAIYWMRRAKLLDVQAILNKEAESN